MIIRAAVSAVLPWLVLLLWTPYNVDIILAAQHIDFDMSGKITRHVSYVPLIRHAELRQQRKVCVKLEAVCAEEVLPELTVHSLTKRLSV